MKIATWNVNNVNKRLPVLLHWLGTARPDVVCLQELKAGDDRFPMAAIEAAGYGAAWRGQAAWNGVAILARDREPVLTRTALPGDPSDRQSRHVWWGRYVADSEALLRHSCRLELDAAAWRALFGGTVEGCVEFLAPSTRTAGSSRLRAHPLPS